MTNDDTLRALLTRARKELAQLRQYPTDYKRNEAADALIMKALALITR